MDTSPGSTVSPDLYSLLESTQPEATPITDAIKLDVHDVPHKRKREEDSKSNSAVQKRRESLTFHAMVDCHASAEQAPSSRQAESFMENPPRVKRPRVNGCSGGTGADISCTSSALRAALWQHVLCYVPPIFLGRILSLNHAFNTYLTPGKWEEDTRPLPNSIMQPLKAEAIWAVSRRRFCPGLPRPIHGFTELDMWRLLKGSNCQICETVKVDTPVGNPQDPWESGPGDTGVRIVWPFGLRCCGPCLQKNTQKVPAVNMVRWLQLRHRKLTVDRKWISPCPRIARFSSCRVSLLPSYQNLIIILVMPF